MKHREHTTRFNAIFIPFAREAPLADNGGMMATHHTPSILQVHGHRSARKHEILFSCRCKCPPCFHASLRRQGNAEPDKLKGRLQERRMNEQPSDFE